MATDEGMIRQVIHNYLKILQVELFAARCSNPVKKDWRRSGGKSSYNRLYFILGGEGSIWIDDLEYLPAPGDMILLPADTPLAYSTNPDNPFRKYWCNFAAAVGDFHLFKLFKCPYLLKVTDMVEVEHKFAWLSQSFLDSDKLAYPLLTKAAFLDILGYFLDHLPISEFELSTSLPTYRLNQIVQYIEDHLAESLTVERLAKEFNYNPNYFIRYFKSMFQMSPNQYIIKARIEKAKRLLSATERSIEQIADEVGMERFYFSRAFKQLTSFSPSRYRSSNKI
ncbi:MAG: AraC family transcriptional regulator [Paenibacillaceae bacterium]|nr:AraC family transcriptional regulator [Paenibacillaceae bacterium]